LTLAGSSGGVGILPATPPAHATLALDFFGKEKGGKETLVFIAALGCEVASLWRLAP
jgi:hypothetical protein